MQNLIRYIAYMLLMLSTISSRAQFITKGLNDSLFQLSDDTTRVMLQYSDPYSLSTPLLALDTGLSVFQRYDATSDGYDIVATMANIGLPHHSLFFRSIQRQPFDIGQKNLVKYYFTPYNLPTYHTRMAYSELNYVMGPRDENYLGFTLGNQLSPGLYLGIDLNVESCLGTFINQRAQDNHFRTILKANSKNQRYKLDFSYIRNKMSFGENGGLLNDSSYEDTTRLDRRIVAVNLNQAKNTLINHRFDLRQSYEIKDSSYNLGGPFLHLSYQSNARVYTDEGDLSHYYQHSYIDSAATHDSIATKNILAHAGWQRIQKGGLSFVAGLRYSFFRYYNGFQTKDYGYLSPTGTIELPLGPSSLKLYGSYALNSYSSDSAYDRHHAEFRASYLLKLFRDKALLNIEAEQTTGAVPIKNLSYYSNHFIWNKSFGRQYNTKLHAVLDVKDYQLSGNLLNIKGYAYFSDSITPEQYKGNLQILSLAFAKQFRFKNLGLNLMALYQQSSNSQILHLPRLSGKTSLFFNFRLFKGALIVHPGFDITYLSAYYADAYNPAIMEFYLQNEKKISQQFYGSFFVNFKIKRARIFLLYNNLSMLFGPYHYYMVLHYPQQDPGLKIGMSWRFYN